MKRHIVDGAHMARVAPETPAHAPIVAFDYRLEEDPGGCPNTAGTRALGFRKMGVDGIAPGAVAPAEHPLDPFRPHMGIISGPPDHMLEAWRVASAPGHDERGALPQAVAMKVASDAPGIEPLTQLDGR